MVGYEGINVLGIEELAATKAYTIGRRGSFKDYVDIYSILQKKLTSLNQIIQLAEEKYDGQFNSRLFLEQMVYLEDITDTEIHWLDGDNRKTKDDLQAFFENQIKELVL